MIPIFIPQIDMQIEKTIRTTYILRHALLYTSSFQTESHLLSRREDQKG
jgi:hypothetical protein